jgi:PAP2 superfamily
MRRSAVIAITTLLTTLVFANPAGATVVSDWNAAALAEVRLSKSLRNGPPMVARALAIAHTCMYDAWAAYDDIAVGTTDTDGSRRRPAAERTDDNKAKAISFAAYRCLGNLYPDGSLPPPLAQPSVRLNAMLLSQGYSLAEACTTDDECRASDPTTAAGIGKIAAQAVIDARRNDGSNQYGDLSPAPCPVPTPFPQPCAAGVYGQTSANPGQTGPYADYVADGYTPYAPANPLMGYCNPSVDVCERQDIVDPNQWQPLIFSNGQDCLDSGSGTEETCPGIQTFIAPHWERVTPFALTSASQFDDVLTIPPPDFMRNNGQYQNDVNDMIQFSRSLNIQRKLIVEYWADGPSSELPPGHWGLFAQFVSQRDSHTIDQDAKMFFAMHNASFDAGIVAWHIKRLYNGVRPITAVRFAKHGQTVTAWGGPGQPIEKILADKWSPYNPGTNLTPSFPGYFSGHSVFSRSSATVLALFTGSDYFGFSTILGPCFGRVEVLLSCDPPQTVTFSYATFNDAADEAGLSRLYGGIHFAEDNDTAQAVGLLIGQQAWSKASTYFNGTPSPTPR